LVDTYDLKFLAFIDPIPFLDILEDYPFVRYREVLPEIPEMLLALSLEMLRETSTFLLSNLTLRYTDVATKDELSSFPLEDAVGGSFLFSGSFEYMSSSETVSLGISIRLLDSYLAVLGAVGGLMAFV
jgi:hypothetical protein